MAISTYENMIYWGTISRAIQMTHGFPSSTFPGFVLIYQHSYCQLHSSSVQNIPDMIVTDRYLAHMAGLGRLLDRFGSPWPSLAILWLATGYQLPRSRGPRGCASVNGFQRGTNAYGKYANEVLFDPCGGLVARQDAIRSWNPDFRALFTMKKIY